MTIDPTSLLSANAGVQVLASSLLGIGMLIPMQPRAARLRPKLQMRALLSAHLDWLMLAFMQWGAVITMTQWPATRSQIVAVLLVCGGWANALPYLFRAFRVDAFVFGGGWLQRTAALLGAVSSAAIVVAWAMICMRVVGGAA